MPLRKWIGTEPIVTRDSKESSYRARRAIPFTSIYGGLLQPPQGKVWDVYAILARMITSANVGDRQFIVKGNYSGLSAIPYAGWFNDYTAVCPASQTRYYGWYKGVSNKTFSGPYNGEINCLPDCEFYADMNIVLSVENAQAGDGGNAILLAYEYEAF